MVNLNRSALCALAGLVVLAGTASAQSCPDNTGLHPNSLLLEAVSQNWQRSWSGSAVPLDGYGARAQIGADMLSAGRAPAALEISYSTASGEAQNESGAVPAVSQRASISFAHPIPTGPVQSCLRSGGAWEEADLTHYRNTQWSIPLTLDVSAPVVSLPSTTVLPYAAFTAEYFQEHAQGVRGADGAYGLFMLADGYAESLDAAGFRSHLEVGVRTNWYNRLILAGGVRLDPARSGSGSGWFTQAGVRF